MKTELELAISELWHLSKTALAGQEDRGRHARMIYVKNELLRTYPHLLGGLSGKRLWFAIEDNTQVFPNYWIMKLLTKVRHITAYQIKLILAHVCLFLPAVMVLGLKIYSVLFGR